MARKQARVAAMQMIYEQMEGGDGGEETLCGLIGFGAQDPEEDAPAPEGALEQPEAEPSPASEDAAPAAPVSSPEFEEDCAFIRSLVSGVTARAAELDGQIAPYLRGWSMDRVARVDLAILRLAVYELSSGDTPQSVIINEAVEMAKRFSSDKSGSFVNGVLGAFVRGEKP